MSHYLDRYVDVAAEHDASRGCGKRVEEKVHREILALAGNGFIASWRRCDAFVIARWRMTRPSGAPSTVRPLNYP
jgi:hypothetical protein